MVEAKSSNFQAGSADTPGWRRTTANEGSQRFKNSSFSANESVTIGLEIIEIAQPRSWVDHGGTPFKANETRFGKSFAVVGFA
jgi:hypothetical protein